VLAREVPVALCFTAVVTAVLLELTPTKSTGAAAPDLTTHALAMIATGAAVYVIERSGQKAAYGRYSADARWFLGPKIPGRVMWIVQEAPARGLPVWYAQQLGVPSREQRWCLAFFLFHYVHRTLVFPLKMRQPKPTPLFIGLLAMAFCVWNGYLQGCAFARPAAPAGASFAVGTAVFCAGLVVNWTADSALRDLRASTTGYAIPRGGLFEYVSCANFTGEVLEWTGFAIASGSIPAAAFAVFAFSNLAPRARDHHAWYLAKFKEYPKRRKALIPLIY
jgi:3-oxo-5-alpha-steroid 4-dehydrogenase 1